ncbi:hypothetical protein PTKIN_Ptkin01aG0015300 [Pterospermum kingtungense]
MEIIETNYYDILGVRPSATKEEIRGAYHLKASEVHPDRNPNDPNAAERYQALTEAYEVLIDPVKREVYDGKEGSRTSSENEASDNLVDPTEAFEDYIGQLTIGSDALSKLASEIDNPLDLPAKLKGLLQSVQKEREEQLAATLKLFLAQYVGDDHAFSQQALSEAKRLRGTDYQVDILHTVGDIYSRQAAQELGKKAIFLGVPFLAEWVRNKLSYRKSLNIIEKEVVPMVQVQEEIRRMKKNLGPAKDAAGSHGKDETSARSLWKLHAADIEVTLVHVCQMVLHDGDATKEELKDRAMALKILGRTFQEEASRDSGTPIGYTSMADIVEGSFDDNIKCVYTQAAKIAAEGYSGSSSSSSMGIGNLLGCLCNPNFDSDADKAEAKCMMPR